MNPVVGTRHGQGRDRVADGVKTFKGIPGTPSGSGLDPLPFRVGVLLEGLVPVLPWPCNGEEHRAVLESFDVVRSAAVKNKKTAQGQVKCPAERPHSDVTLNCLDRDSSLRSMFWNSGVRRERDEDNAEIVVLHERLGALPAGEALAVKLLEFAREVKFEERCCHRLGVRPPVRNLVAMGVGHREPPGPDPVVVRSVVSKTIDDRIRRLGGNRRGGDALDDVAADEDVHRTGDSVPLAVEETDVLEQGDGGERRCSLSGARVNKPEDKKNYAERSCHRGTQPPRLVVFASDSDRPDLD